MRKLRLAMTGIGNVGRRLLELIERQREILLTRFDLQLVLTGVCDSSGAILNPQGLNPAEILSVKEQKKGVAMLPQGIQGITLYQFVSAVQANILIELTL